MSLSSPNAIEPVQRAFAVLEALNRRGASTLSEISAIAALPKSTTARLLETLVALGYATRISRQLGYRITDRVLALAAGLRFVDHLVDAAVAPMNEFTDKTGWPLYLGTVRSGATLVRYSTAPQSPLSFEDTGYDRKIPVVESAIGLAYLANCSDLERAGILRDAAALGGKHAIGPRRRAALDRELADIRARGFASTRPWRRSRLNGIAVPAMRAGHVLGAVSVRYPKSAMTEEEAAARFVPRLRELAERIAAIALSQADAAG
jgi:IclR family mhp operon transcriptional activator